MNLAPFRFLPGLAFLWLAPPALAQAPDGVWTDAYRYFGDPDPEHKVPFTVANENGNVLLTVYSNPLFEGAAVLVLNTPLTAADGPQHISVKMDPPGPAPGEYNFLAYGGWSIGNGWLRYDSARTRGIDFKLEDTSPWPDNQRNEAGDYKIICAKGYLGAFVPNAEIEYYELAFDLDAAWENVTYTITCPGGQVYSLTGTWCGGPLEKLWFWWASDDWLNGQAVHFTDLHVGQPLPKPPQITSTAQASATLGQAFAYQITAYNSPSAFAATGLPGWASLEATNGLISGLPDLAGTYQITLSASNAAGVGTAPLVLTVSAGVVTNAPSDNFATRALLSGYPLHVRASNADATKEPNEPNHGDNSGGHSIWWTWTPPTDGTLTVTTAGSGFDTLLAVYAGNSLSNLTTLGSQDIGQADERIVCHVHAGTAYAIAIDGYDGDTGQAVLNLDFKPAPANDDFANRVPLSGNSLSLTNSNIAATKEAGEPDEVAGYTATGSLWWSWQAPAAGRLTLTTAGSAIDTLLAIYAGDSVSNLTSLAEEDDGDSNERINLQVNEAKIYQIDIAGYDGAEGQVVLNLRFTPGPPNDDFTNATVLAGTSLTLSGTNIAAYAEQGEPNHLDSAGGKSVWWSWTPAADGPAMISTLGSAMDTVLVVYTGSSLSNLTQVAGRDDTLGDTVTFMAHAGTRYSIVVDGYGGAEGVFPLGLAQDAATPLARAGFDLDADFWTVVSLYDPVVEETYDMVQSGPLAADWYEENGTDGYIGCSDFGSGTWFFQAAYKFLGDQSLAYGGWLKFDLTQSPTDSQFDCGDVVLIGAQTTLVFDTTTNPGLEWTSYRIPLREGAGWKKDTLQGPAPTASEFAAVLRGLTALRIRGEFRTGSDSGYLDNVAWEAPAPTLLVEHGVPGQVIVSWPADFPNATLEWTASLGPGAAWEAVSEKPVPAGNRAALTLSAAGGQRFYRLKCD
jgi:hypothetical protein